MYNRYAEETGSQGDTRLIARVVSVLRGTHGLDGEVFEPLRDPAQFATAMQHPVMRTVAWANGADLAPEFLIDLLHDQKQRAA